MSKREDEFFYRYFFVLEPNERALLLTNYLENSIMESDEIVLSEENKAILRDAAKGTNSNQDWLLWLMLVWNLNPSAPLRDRPLLSHIFETHYVFCPVAVENWIANRASEMCRQFLLDSLYPLSQAIAVTKMQAAFYANIGLPPISTYNPSSVGIVGHRNNSKLAPSGRR